MLIRKFLNKFYLFFPFIILICNSLLKYSAEEIKWEIINDKEDINKKTIIEWEIYDQESIFDESEMDFIDNKYKKNTQLENEEISLKEFFYLGFAVPNAFVMNRKDFMIYLDQLFPFQKSDIELGTANQNYSVFTSYGISNDLMLM